MTRISIASIDTADRLRALDPAWVDLLAEEIAVDGLVEPVRVAVRGNGYKLIDGARRIAAHQKLGLDEIEAVAEDEAAFADDASVRLGEIKGHMLQGELTALDRAVTVAAWCDLYKAANTPVKRGPKAKPVVIAGTSDEALEEFSANIAPNWSEAAQAALNLSRRTVFLSLKIARIEIDVRAKISLHPIADVQRELLLLAAQTPVRQRALADLLVADSAEITTVAEAIAQFDALPQPIRVDKVDKLVERFSGLGERDQFKFFDKHADRIDAWMARRNQRKAS